MDQTEHELRARHFVEEVGLLFESSGVQRMAGRVLGYLLICEPPHQSSAQLAEVLSASRGAISQATRSLLQMGLMERVPVPGDRSTYFALRSGVWTQLLQAEVARSALFRELMERGLRLVEQGGLPLDSPHRLRELRDLFAFMEQEFPALIARWEASRRNT